MMNEERELAQYVDCRSIAILAISSIEQIRITYIFPGKGLSDSLVLAVGRDTVRPSALEDVVRVVVVQDQGAALLHLQEIATLLSPRANCVKPKN